MLPIKFIPTLTPYRSSDERFAGDPLPLKFTGQLRPDQEKAVKAMMAHDTGVLCAPTAFGKTVTAAALIARRGVNTLILVHRTELLKQWQERLRTFIRTLVTAVAASGGECTRTRIQRKNWH